MKKGFIVATIMLWFVLVAIVPAFARTNGSKFFGCIEMRWQIPAGQSSVQLEFLKKGETFGRLSLSHQENFRQFSFAAESVFIEGRMRTNYDLDAHKGVLHVDSLTYRCYSPADQWFSGDITEFDLPDNLP